MKKKNFLWSLLTMIMVCMLSVSLISCGGDDNDDPNNGQPVNPGTNVNDPTGTVTLAMRNTDNGNTYLDNIRIKNENFIGASFVSLGAVRGLGNVSTIPTSGWADQVAVEPGYGYVAFSNNQFYRIYVVDNIVNTSGGVIGADIKYQKPFKGSDEAISIDEKSLTFGNSGGSQSLVFNNKNIILFEATSDQSWCKVSKSSTHNNYFLYNAITVYVDSKTTPGTDNATITLETAYNRKTTISVSRMGAAPVLELAENEKTITATEQTFNVGFSTNYDDLEMENTNDWLTAEIVNGTTRMKTKAAAIRFIGKERKAETRAGSSTGNATSYYLRIKATTNYDNQTRTGKITLRTKDKKLSQTLTVKQTGAELAFTKDAVEFECAASSGKMQFTSLIAPKDLRAKSNADWCTVTVVDNYVSISVTANQTDAERKAQITLFTTQGNASTSLTVTQKKGEIIFADENSISMVNKAGTTTVKFTSPYEKDVLKVSSSAKWCTPTISSASQLSISVTENPSDKVRSATITLSSSDGKVKNTLKVTQAAATMEVKSKVWLDRKASTQTLTLTTSLTNWTAKSNVSWCTLSQNSNQLTIRIEATTVDRTGTISFDGLSTTIQLIQSKYAVGDNYEEGNLKGKVLLMNGENRVIYQDLGYDYWSTENVATGATDEHDGKKNMEVIKKIPNWQTLYPAFTKVEALNINGETGWIFPAWYQLKDMGYNNVTGDWWSSTEADATYAYLLNRGITYKYYKFSYSDVKYLIRAIHMF